MKREVMETAREQEDEALFDPDAALMIRVKNGDLRAFEALVDRYKQTVSAHRRMRAEQFLQENRCRQRITA